ncbi:MAG TPA: TIGR03960 family B12-binding radical SAM protein [Candidatus Limiplasma sp.]|nr:TIGR03960 family B12-binding radical SAM protein [Candidatus Limiplasma sp.]HRX09315.1 TIGR03960 family B12-binding radical SAM protein [Candidatus Limiplasma sp.]
MTDRIEQILERVEKPVRYIGGEVNSGVIPFAEAEVSFAFCFPDTYEVAMSHLGMKILYGILNAMPGVLCERVCMPWVDMISELKAENIPLFSLESRTPLHRFDIVGFTLQYEMSYSNILHMLSMGGVPVKAADRGDGDPIVVAGGPCASNPEPLHAFIDAFMIGDGEDVIGEVTTLLRDLKKAGVPRAERLRRLAQIEGVYVPSLYKVTYQEDGTIQSFSPVDETVPAVVRKRFVTDLESAFYPTAPPVPYTQVVHDRIVLEIMRGCTQGCRFCHAGMFYRPVRERSVEKLLQLAQELADNTGYEEMSLSSLSSGDYTRLPELCQRLQEQFKDQHMSLSLPSLRIDSVLKDTLIESDNVRKSSLTFAPEAGTQRLRDVINKGVTQEDLAEKLTDSFENGWNSVKLYFMTGLPTETMEDIEGIFKLSKAAVDRYYAVPKPKRAKGLRITVSTSVFVPKPFTPFQWCAQDTPEAIREKQLALRNMLGSLRAVHYNWHDSLTSRMEACFALGDRRMADVLYRAFELGCKLDGWSEQYRNDLWLKAFADTGVDPAFYANRARGEDEILPWEFIDIGVTKAFLLKEWHRAQRAEVTPDCRQHCNACGLQQVKGLCAACE